MAASLKAVPTPQPTAKLVKITPKMAADWMGKNVNNRPVRASVVDMYSRDMAAKNWQFTGEAIKFDLDGNLLDGQHRLFAIVKSGVTVQMLVVRDVRTECQAVMDSGAKRTAADALGLSGTKNASVVAAVARFGLLLDRSVANRGISHSEIAEWVDANPDIHSAATFVARAHKSLDVQPKVAGYAFLMIARVNASKAEEFFEALINHTTDGKGDPRNTLLKRLQNARNAGERLSPEAQLQFIVRAWNAWRKNESLHVLKTTTGTLNGGVAVSLPKAV